MYTSLTPTPSPVGVNAPYRVAPDTFVIPERVKSIPTRATERTYYTEALRDYLLNRSDILGDTYQERYTRLYRGGLQILSALSATCLARWLV